MAVNIAAGQVADDNGASFETAGGTKVGIFSTPGDEIVAYKTVDGTPSLIGVAQTSGTVHGGGSTSAIAAWIDSADIVHVVAIASSVQTRSIAYNTISDPDGTPAWGTWELAASFTDAAPTQSRNVDIDIDSNDKPHVLFTDGVKVKGTTYGGIWYTEKTGASWSTPVEVSGGGSVNYGGCFLSLKSGDDGEAVYYQETNGDAYYNTLTSGSWGSETAYTLTAANSQGVAIDTGGTVRRLHLSGGSGTTLINILENNSDVGYDTPNQLLVENIAADIYLDGTDRYIIFIDTNDDVRLISNDGGGWTDEGVLQTGTFNGVVAGWGYNNLNNTTTIDYLYDDGTDVFWDEFSLGVGPQTVSVSGTITPSGTISKLPKKQLIGAITPVGTAIKKAFKAFAGAITPEGVVTLSKKFAKALAGSLTPTGDVTKFVKKNLVGSITPTGVVTYFKKAYRSFAGSTTPTGIVAAVKVGVLYFKSLAGSITPTGAVSKKSWQTFVGTITPAGTLAKKMFSTFVGTLTPTGNVAKKMFESLAGSMTPSGTITALKLGVLYFKSLAGSITPTGAISKKSYQSFVGAITAAGTVAKKSAQSFVGAVTPTGIVTLSVKWFRSFAGAVTPSGILGAIKLGVLNFKSLAGSITPTGTVSKKALKNLIGSITPSGTIAKKVYKFLAGSITPTGTAVKKVFKNLIGAITPTGTVSAIKAGIKTLISLAGTITPSGDVRRKTSKIIAGLITPVGTAQKKVSKSLSGAMTTTGIVVKKTFKSFSGVVTSLGTLVTALNPSLAFSKISLTLQERGFAMTLPNRDFLLRLRKRIFNLVFPSRDVEGPE